MFVPEMFARNNLVLPDFTIEVLSLLISARLADHISWGEVIFLPFVQLLASYMCRWNYQWSQG